MAPKRSVILRWTGRGNLTGLQNSVAFVLRSNKIRARVWRAGRSVVVEGPEPATAGVLLEYIPGVEWIAYGFTTNSFGGLSGASGELARRYLRRGDRFAVEADGTARYSPSDVAGAVTSGILDSVKGARVSSEAPKLRFRAAFDGPRGVVGIEAKPGPGGVPTGSQTAACLVSGGLHSSVAAWMAILSGFRLTLVHWKSSDESLRAAARLYSELSHRSDPRGLMLEVLDGSSEKESLAEYAAESTGPVFGGFHAGGGQVPGALSGRVTAPLYLLPEERFRAEFDSLHVRGYESKADWTVSVEGKVASRRFGGVAADVSGVLDGLR